MSIHGIKRPKLNSYWKKWEGESKAIYIHTHTEFVNDNYSTSNWGSKHTELITMRRSAQKRKQKKKNECAPQGRPMVPRTTEIESWDAAVVQSLSPVRLFTTRGLQHARLPCPSPSPGACSSSRPSGR